MSYSLSFSQALYTIIYVGDKIQQGMYEFIPTQKISNDLNIPRSSTALLLRRLNRAGIIETREGANGGVRLAIQPDQLTVLDVLEAIEQERSLFQTNVQLNVDGQRPARAHQAIASTLNNAEAAMKKSLEGVSVADLLAQMQDGD